MTATVDPWTYSQPVAETVPVSGPEPSHRAPGDVDRARTRWRLDRQRNRRRVSRALDEVCVRLYGAEEAARYGIRPRGGV